MIPRSKKGAMQLGISTIVILVIAMVVIGSGISFIRTFFSQGQEALMQSIPSSDLTVNPTRDEPLAMSTTELKAKQGTSKSIQLGLYNKETTQLDFELDLTCKNSTNGNYSDFSTVATGTTIPSGESAGKQVIFDIPSDASQESPFVCRVEATGTPTSGGSSPSQTISKDLIIRATG